MGTTCYGSSQSHPTSSYAACNTSPFPNDTISGFNSKADRTQEVGESLLSFHYTRESKSALLLCTRKEYAVSKAACTVQSYACRSPLSSPRAGHLDVFVPAGPNQGRCGGRATGGLPGSR